MGRGVRQEARVLLYKRPLHMEKAGGGNKHSPQHCPLVPDIEIMKVALAPIIPEAASCTTVPSNEFLSC